MSDAQASDFRIVQVRAALEDALTKISGVASTLQKLGADADNDVYAYLGGQLQDHRLEALEAFLELFGLDRFTSPLVIPAPKVSAGHAT